MKNPRFLILAAAALSLAVGAWAQTQQKAGPQTAPKTKIERKAGQKGHHFRKRGHFFMGRIAQKLQLTDAQKTQIKAVKAEARKNAKALFENKGMAKEAKKEQLKQLRKHTHDQVMNILTPAQRTQLEEMRANFKKKMEERRKIRGSKTDGAKPAVKVKTQA